MAKKKGLPNDFVVRQLLLSLNEKNDIQIITGGLGLNFGVFYADLAYLHKASKLNGLFYYYETSKGQVIESPEFQTKFKDNEFRLTLGIRF